MPDLIGELGNLQSAGEAATRRLEDNLNAITSEFERSLSPLLQKLDTEVRHWKPRERLVDDLKAAFVHKDKYTKILLNFGKLVEAALTASPAVEMPEVAETACDTNIKKLNTKLETIEAAIRVAGWFAEQSPSWTKWWSDVTAAGSPLASESADKKDTAESADTKHTTESLTAYLIRLSNALAQAEPYRKAADAMTTARTAGRTISTIEKETTKRDEIAECLSPLKSLGALATFVARQATLRTTRWPEGATCGAPDRGVARGVQN